VKSSLAVRDAELARARTAQDDARNRMKQEADASLAEARKKWHAGEAEDVRAYYRNLSPGDKAALVAFVSGL